MSPSTEYRILEVLSELIWGCVLPLVRHLPFIDVASVLQILNYYKCIKLVLTINTYKMYLTNLSSTMWTQ